MPNKKPDRRQAVRHDIAWYLLGFVEHMSALLNEAQQVLDAERG